MTRNIYAELASAVLFAHLVFILWVMLGAFVTRRSRSLRWFHIASLAWGVFIDVVPWPCPLTLLENWLEARAGIQVHQGGFLLRYLDMLVYPNVSEGVVVVGGVTVCLLNLVFYAWRFRKVSHPV